MLFAKLLTKFMYCWPFATGRYRLFTLLSDEAKEYLDTLPQPVKMRTGVKLYVRPGDHLSRLFRYFGTYEPETCQLLREYANPDEVFLDVGANLGLHSLGVAKDVGCPVAAFEPGGKTADCLERSIAVNHLEDKVTVFRVALASGDGVATFVEPPAHVGQSALESPTDPAHRDGDRFQVQVARLDHLKVFNDYLDDLDMKVGLIKMDIEGAEEEALKGMWDLIKRHRPTIVMEIYDGNLNGFDSSRSSVIAMLESVGYELAREFDFNGLFLPTKAMPLPVEADAERASVAVPAL